MSTNVDLRATLATRRASREAGGTAIATRYPLWDWLQQPDTLRTLVAALPPGMEVSRFRNAVETEIRKNMALLGADPHSFKLAIVAAAQLGLLPGPLGHSYLTGPFNRRLKNGTSVKEVVLIIGYKGLQELAYRAGTVEYIDAVAVHEGEPFKVVRGSRQELIHEERPECQDAPIIAYYAIAQPKAAGVPVFEVMWPGDIEKIRQRSRAKADGPWQTDYETMAKKTVVRRMLNRGKVRLTPDIAAAIAEEESRDIGYDTPDSLMVAAEEEIKGLPEANAEAEPKATDAGAQKPAEEPQTATTDTLDGA